MNCVVEICIILLSGISLIYLGLSEKIVRLVVIPEEQLQDVPARLLTITCSGARNSFQLGDHPMHFGYCLEDKQRKVYAKMPRKSPGLSVFRNSCSGIPEYSSTVRELNVCPLYIRSPVRTDNFSGRTIGYCCPPSLENTP